MLPMVNGDRERSRAAGANATPTFFIGTRKMSGVVPFSDLKPVIDAALAASQANPGR
jgi:protein-disulfide isomerase